MSKRAAIIYALLAPAGVFVTAVVVALGLLMSETFVAGCAILLLWIATWALTLRMRRQQLAPLLALRAPMRTLKLEDLAVYSDPRVDAAHGQGHASTDEKLMADLESRRLVIFYGEKSSGRSRMAFEALKASFGRYTVLVPAKSAANGQPPLTSLLTSRALSWGRHYILWLDSLGRLLEEGLDPRIIERWLATGAGRVAVGTITPADRERIRIAGPAAANALERAVFVHVEPPPYLPHPGTASEAYRSAKIHKPDLARLIFVIGVGEVLGLGGRSREFAAGVLEKLTGREFDPETVDRLSRPASVLYYDDDRLLRCSDPDLLETVDRELSRAIDATFVDALTDSLHGRDLVQVGQALALRERFDAAEQALHRAQDSGDRDVQNAASRALGYLTDLRQGPSGVTLSNTGGVDFAERMGPLQREASEKRLPEASDGVFDAKLPSDQNEAWPARFYRLTMRRAVARVAVLAALDTLAIAAATIAALAVRAATQGDQVRLIDDDFIALMVSGAIVTVLVAVWLGLYRPESARARPHLILATMTMVSVVVAAGLFVAAVDFGSLLALGVLFAVAFTLDLILRFGYDQKSRSWLRSHELQPRVLVMGPQADVVPFVKNLKSREGRPLVVPGFLTQEECDHRFCQGTYTDLTDCLHELHIAQLMIVDRDLDTATKAEHIGLAQSFGVDVSFAANDNEIILGAVGRLDDHELVYAPAALISPEALELKRLLDRVVVTLTLPVWAGVIGLYAAYSTLRRPGQPVFVTVDRVGMGNIGFSMFRLRTRTYFPDGSRGAVATGRIEHFFEVAGLDEVPQVFNVLLNEMSLVGPRPLAADDVKQLTRDRRRTLGARPGMTGRWQTSWPHGASEADMRVVDADYLRRWRIRYDLEILLRTPVAILRRGWYLSDTALEWWRRGGHAR